MSQKELIFEYFKKNPNRNIGTAEVVEWAGPEWEKRTGKIFKDPDRAIRKLREEDLLIKIKDGVYRYEPNSAKKRKLEEFTAKQKKEILERDGYQCFICGMGKREGIEVHVDHVVAKDRGGKATIENGRTLCSKHNMLKKTLNQTETGKKMFIQLLKIAQKKDVTELENFFTELLEVYEKHDINGHIEWKKKKAKS